MFIVCTRLLWAFDFGEEIDVVTGERIKCSTTDFFRGFLPHINPYKCTIAPRSAQHAELIREEFLNSAEAFLPFEGDMPQEDKDYVAEMRKTI